jgi:hypothetical protein
LESGSYFGANSSNIATVATIILATLNLEIDGLNFEECPSVQQGYPIPTFRQHFVKLNMF